MNGESFHLFQRINSSRENNCIKSISINTKEIPLTPLYPNKNSKNKEYKFKNCYFSAKKSSNKSIEIFKLSSRHKNSIQNCIFFERNLDLLEKQMKKLNEEKRKIMCKINTTQNIEKFKEKNKENYKKKKNFISNLIKERQKEMEEKKFKVKMMKNQENTRFKNIVIFKKINSENLSERKRLLKRKILQDISEEKNKLNKEKKRKIDLIKKVDDDILKRKKETEKRENLIKKEKLEQEIKIQENFNKKLAKKIYEYQKIGLEKINFLQQIKLKVENKF